ncbi:hypothetical protein SDJN02_14361, partial [Cucurbita argyrosperma subsp. argyrosperma]
MADLLGFSSWTNIGLPSFICLTSRPCCGGGCNCKIQCPRRQGERWLGYQNRGLDFRFGFKDSDGESSSAKGLSSL